MTAVVDPFGTPAVFYSCQTTTIQNISVVANDANPGTATVVALPTQYSVLVVTVTVNVGISPTAPGSIKLPADGNTKIGDVAEIHAKNGSGGLHVFDNGSASIIELENNQVVTLRKIAANTWRKVNFFAD